MTITEKTVKKIELINDFFILAIPEENNFYSLYLMNEKEPGCMRLFGSLSPQLENDEMLKRIAFDGFMYGYETWETINALIINELYNDDDNDDE